MYPILYEATELNFTSNGIGMLAGCTSCVVTEERNGEYECEFTVPSTAKHFSEITLGRIILVPHDETKDLQPFVIYRSSTPMNGEVTFNARHVSYGLTNVILKPFTATSVTQALSKFETEVLTAQPFTFWTSKSTPGNFFVKRPMSAREALAGTQGSILDIYGGGEYEFDKYAVKLYQHRGSDNGVTIRYGKNLTELEQVFDGMDIYDAIIPYWVDSEDEENVVYGGIVTGTIGTSDKVVAVDMTDQFEEQPTVAQLEAKAETYLNNQAPWQVNTNIEVDFVALWQTEEYKDIAALERVKLCDTVRIEFPLIGVSVSEEVIKVEYDVLRERYSKIELGQPKKSFAETIVNLAENFTTAAVQQTTSDLEQAITNATQLITGGLGGHVVIGRNANGKPQEILIMDTEDILTAQNVLRINVNGIGFSSTGYSGTYTTAWTLDGGFVADFITTGYLSCNRIKGGVLELGGNNNTNGWLKVMDSNGVPTTEADNDGIRTKSLTAEEYVYVYGGSRSRMYIPTNKEGVTPTTPTDDAYVDISNRGMSIAASTTKENAQGPVIIKTVYPSDGNGGSYNVIDVENMVWTTDTYPGDVTYVTTEEWESEEENVTVTSNYVKHYDPDGVYQGITTHTFTNATRTAKHANAIIVGAEGIVLDVNQMEHLDAEYIETAQTPNQGWKYVLDIDVPKRRKFQLGDTLRMDYKAGDYNGPTSIIDTSWYIDSPNLSADFPFNSFTVSGLDLAGTAVRKLFDNYPTQGDMKGAVAAYQGTGLVKYIGLGLNTTQNRLFVYGGNSATSLAYIGRVDLV